MGIYFGITSLLAEDPIASQGYDRERPSTYEFWGWTPTPVPTPSPTPTPTPVPTPVPTPTPTPVPVYQENGNTVDVWLTYYTCPPFCETMRNGEIVYEGAVACGGYFEMGQRIRIKNDPTLRTYVCADTGLGGWYWIDVFFENSDDGRRFISIVGSQVTVELVE